MRTVLIVLLAAITILAALVFADVKGLADLPMEKLPIIGSWVAKQEADSPEVTVVPDPAPAPQADPVPAPAPREQAPPPVAAAPVEDEDDEAARLHPMPRFKSIEDIMQGWTQLPPTAFPRECTLTQPAQRQIRNAEGAVIGSSEIPAGTTLIALRAEGSQLQLAASEDSAATTVVPLESTDLKETFTTLYDDFQEKVRSSILAKRAAERDRIAQASGTPRPRPHRPTGGLSRPSAVAVSSSVPRDDPRFAPMVEAIEGGRYKEIQLGNVTAWQWGGSQEVDGQSYDVGMISFKVKTMFGPLDTEAMALMSGGRIDRFLYTGSMEPVQ